MSTVTQFKGSSNLCGKAHQIQSEKRKLGEDFVLVKHANVVVNSWGRIIHWCYKEVLIEW